ncbi:protein of unknown function [Streptococcus thermophilus]|uniref:Uncharacterized protein n=1 Tax=Streptococcus thermophilus TaxID=1308 RepID=A0A7U7C9E2_STRTR|nr:protein of unknown function [Streptococcus thermophilus]CAD0145454.1 protein of unknown function [Streptococcus thermophilus]CAD0147552.1 protein of unknown function [Streptococcus thermophilus]CAD0150181.1 protein of unknown function [Streptococcus thermophilus]CAD0152505.1 protein of unknown function [Streptococcus thermophilus]
MWLTLLSLATLAISLNNGSKLENKKLTLGWFFIWLFVNCSG